MFQHFDFRNVFLAAFRNDLFAIQPRHRQIERPESHTLKPGSQFHEKRLLQSWGALRLALFFG